MVVSISIINTHDPMQVFHVLNRVVREVFIETFTCIEVKVVVEM